MVLIAFFYLFDVRLNLKCENYHQLGARSNIKKKRISFEVNKSKDKLNYLAIYKNYTCILLKKRNLDEIPV